MNRENFLKGVWLGGGRRKKIWWCQRVFSLGPPKCFPTKMKKNWERECNLWYGQKCSQLLSWATLAFLFFYFFYLLLSWDTLSLFFFWATLAFFFFFFFWFPKVWGDSDLFCFCSFFWKLDVIFFFLTWLLFFNKFGWFFFFVCQIFVLIGYHFLIRVCE